MLLKIIDRLLKRMKIETKGEVENDSSNSPEEEKENCLKQIGYNYLIFTTLSLIYATYLFFQLDTTTKELERGKLEYRQLESSYNEMQLKYDKMSKER